MKTLVKILTSVLITTTTGATMAAPEAVKKSDCNKVDTTKPFILVLDSGDDLLQSITACAKDAKLKSAAISGLEQVWVYLVAGAKLKNAASLRAWREAFRRSNPVYRCCEK